MPAGGGMIDLDLNDTALEWLAEYLLAFGADAMVLEPDALIGLMKHKINSLYQQYCQ